MNLVQVSRLICLIVIFNFSGKYLGAQPNKPPVVKLKLIPELNSFEFNQTVRYQIEVIDSEDGSTSYEEINPREVVLKIAYMGAVDIEKKEGEKIEDSAIQLLMKNGCLNCHTSRGKLIGPSFDRIAERYQAKSEIIETLIRRIKTGSSGNWGDVIMPSNAGADEKELEKILSWILQQKPDAQHYVLFGISGQITFGSIANNVSKNGKYYLSASYLDHGPGKQQQGTSEIILYPALK
jgi:cytochrome c